MKKISNENISAESLIQKVKLPDLKRHCIIRGIPFEYIGKYSILQLQSWLIKNYNNQINTNRLNEYDDWINNLLKEIHSDDALFNPDLNLGYQVKDEDGHVLKSKKIRGMKQNKKKPRTEEGLRIGSRQEYIVTLAKTELSKEEIITKVEEKYSDINKGYIITWINKYRKGKLKK